MKKKGLIIFVAIMIATMCMALAACSNNVTYTVSFESNGGTEVSDLTVDKGASVDLPIPTCESFIFDGWFDNADLSGSALSSPYTPVADTTLYAKWSSSLENADCLGAYVGQATVEAGCFDVIVTLESGGICSVATYKHNEEGEIETGTYTVAGNTVTLSFYGETVGGTLQNDTIMLEEFGTAVDVLLKKTEDPTKYVGTYSETIDDTDLGTAIITLALGSDKRFSITIVFFLDVSPDEHCLYYGNYYISGNDVYLLGTEYQPGDETEVDPPDQPGGSDEEARVVGTKASLYGAEDDTLLVAEIRDGAMLLYMKDYMSNMYTMLTPTPTSEKPCADGAHSFSSWIRVTMPNCIDGTEKRFCTICGERETRTGTATVEHVFDSIIYWYEEFDPDIYHKLRCSACDTPAPAPELHTYGEWKISKEPTCFRTGWKTQRCSVCGYRHTQEIPMTEHDFILNYDNTNHWQECSVCHSEYSEESHIYGEWTDEISATCTKDGSHKHACTVCEYQETVSVSATGAHKFVQSFDNTNHWQECSVCNEKKDITT